MARIGDPTKEIYGGRYAVGKGILAYVLDLRTMEHDAFRTMREARAHAKRCAREDRDRERAAAEGL